MADARTDREIAIDLLLKEHDLLGGDLASRVERQSQAFNLVVVVVGATITGIGALLGTNAKWHAETATAFLLAFEICVVLAGSMCMTAPLALLFFDDELMIFAAVAYIKHEWKPALRDAATSAEQVIAPRKLFDGDFSWKHAKVNDIGRYDHSVVARSRWWLFNLPLIAATMTLAGTAAAGRKLFWPLVEQGTGHWLYTAHMALAVAALTLYVIGCIAYWRVARAWRAARLVRRHCC
ncbi:MAG TPA: hypothetical protein VFL57_18545 [Bryobacteraceae bacterium]|nr:hypothetical protein [Bryobacteraceae bacterium]